MNNVNEMLLGAIKQSQQLFLKSVQQNCVRTILKEYADQGMITRDYTVSNTDGKLEVRYAVVQSFVRYVYNVTDGKLSVEQALNCSTLLFDRYYSLSHASGAIRIVMLPKARTLEEVTLMVTNLNRSCHINGNTYFIEVSDGKVG